QGGERREFGEVFEHGFADAHGACVFHAAVDHAVAYADNRTFAEQSARQLDDLACGGAVVEALRLKGPVIDFGPSRRRRSDAAPFQSPRFDLGTGGALPWWHRRART